MDAERVDERDSSWESTNTRYRVYHYYWSDHPDEPHGGNYSVDTHDLTGCDVLDAVRWIQERLQPEDLYAVALVADNKRGERGLIWLTGEDVVYSDPRTPPEQEVFTRMRARRERDIVLPE